MNQFRLSIGSGFILFIVKLGLLQSIGPFLLDLDLRKFVKELLKIIFSKKKTYYIERKIIAYTCLLLYFYQ